jgi:hypothetical protein
MKEEALARPLHLDSAMARCDWKEQVSEKMRAQDVNMQPIS